MPLDELLAKYQWTGGHDGDDNDAGFFPLSPASLSDASDSSDGKDEYSLEFTQIVSNS